MPKTTEQRVYDRLNSISQQGLDAIKELLWTDLAYDYTNAMLPSQQWPGGTQALLAGASTLLGKHGDFHVIYTPLKTSMTLTAERQIIAQLLPHHPYALFIFSDPTERHWHLVNVKLDRPTDEAATATTQHILRRIAVGPGEQLRTAAERIALLDIDALSQAAGKPLPLSPLAVQEQHDRAFDVEAVTNDFFSDYEHIFRLVEERVTGLEEAEARRLFAQQFFNRLLFLMFIERKGWLTFQGRSDYLRALWETYRRERHSEAHDDGPAPSEAAGESFYGDRLKVLFFAGLNNPGSVDYLTQYPNGAVQHYIGDVPYLNGGLFEKAPLDERADVGVPDAVFPTILDDLLYRYNFTVTESTPLDVEVAVDPEMLGKIFEELVTGRHESGSYYTPKPIVAFMSREALKGYLHDRCSRESAEALAAFVDARDAAGLSHIECVGDALREVRACDPACGSGAYLLGMLHELVDLRTTLAGAADSPSGKSLYDRKLAIIQNNLYGVDIDPFAVNIARLRLWLSLIVEYEGDTPPPLPNLDFKIEVGDSLTAPAPGELQPDLFHYQQVQDYFRLKAQFMTAHGPEKKQLKTQIAQLQVEIAQWASEQGDTGFDWAVQFAEIFTPQQDTGTVKSQMSLLINATPGQMQLTTSGPVGFDIVVANPPYVDQRLFTSELKKQLRLRYPEVYLGKADLYVYFYARALHLLRKGGIGCFITSNKWFQAGYGKKLRKHLNEQAIVDTVIDFGDLPIFNAVAYPCIVVYQKGSPQTDHTIRALNVESLSLVDRLSTFVKVQAWGQPRTSLTPDGWVLLRPEMLYLLRKLRQGNKSLKQYVNGQLYSGIKTGFNQAYIVDAATRKQLIDEDPTSDILIKPWLRGRNINAWSSDWHGEYLIIVKSSGDQGVDHLWRDAETEPDARSIFAKAFPAIHKYLAHYEKHLRERSDQGKFWWEFRTCGYYAELEKPKIIWAKYGIKPSFAYDTQQYLCGNTVFLLPTEDLALVGILNSRVVQWFAKNTFNLVRGGYIEWIPTNVGKLPIPDPTPDQRAAIEALVRQLLDAQGQGPHVAAWERDLNALVYQVYGLTEDEIALIEGEVGRPRP